MLVQKIVESIQRLVPHLTHISRSTGNIIHLRFVHWNRMNGENLDVYILVRLVTRTTTVAVAVAAVTVTAPHNFSPYLLIWELNLCDQRAQSSHSWRKRIYDLYIHALYFILCSLLRPHSYYALQTATHTIHNYAQVPSNVESNEKVNYTWY